MRSRLPAIVVASACLLALAPPAFGAEGERRPFQTGLFDPPTYALHSNLPFRRTKQAGATVVRISLSWRGTAPAVPAPILFNPADPADPGYDFASIDEQVSRVVSAGLEPIVLVGGAPRWAQRCNDEARSQLCDPDPMQLRQFAIAIAKRFDGSFDPDGLGPEQTLPRVRFWQALNEPNLHLFFSPQRNSSGEPISPELYRSLLNNFTGGIKAGNPRAKVLAAGLAPLGKPPGVAPLEFMRQLLCMGGVRNPRPTCDRYVNADIWTTHPYTTGGPTHEALAANDVSMGDLPEMARLLRAAERAGHFRSSYRRAPFWITEFSWDSNPPDPKGLGKRLHARWMDEAFFRMWKAGVTTVVWFLLRDFADTTDQQRGGATYESGLYLRGAGLRADTPKLSLQAFRFPFVALRRGAVVTLWGRTPESNGGSVQIQVKIDGAWRRMARLRAGADGIFYRRIAVPRRVRLSSPNWRELPVRARFAGEESVPFSMRFIGDRYVRPFGSVGGSISGSARR